MTFTTEIAKQESERTTLARVTPKRNITSTLVLQAGTTYAVTIPYNVMAVTLNGVNMTRITTGTPIAGQFIYDQLTGVLTVNSATAPNVTTGVFIAFYRVYFCTGAGTAAYDDPSITTGLLQQWEPRLNDSPTFGSFFDNALTGVFSYTDLALNGANGDSWFQQFITADDSFKDASVEVWQFVDSIANILKLYTGSVTKLSVRAGGFTLNVSDRFNLLRAPAYMGDLENESIFRLSRFPTMEPQKAGLPIPYICGRSSKHTSRNIQLNFNPFGAQELDENSVNTAIFTTAVTPDKSQNRTALLCRTQAQGIRQNGFTSVTQVLYLGEFNFFVTVTGANALYRVGETFKWAQGGFTWCAHVSKAGNFQFGTQTFLAANVNIATDVITLAAHGMATGSRFSLSGSLPTPLVSQTIYYANVLTANTIEVCSTLANAQAGTQINLTTTGGGGTKTVAKWDVGTTYNLYLANACRQDDPKVNYSPDANFTAGVATNVNSPAVGAMIRFGSEPYFNTMYLRNTADYTMGNGVPASGGREWYLILNQWFETNLFEDTIYPSNSTSTIDPNPANLPIQTSNFCFNPTQHKLIYTIAFDIGQGHGRLIRRMCEAVGMATDVASFTAADAALPTEVFMQIPARNENDYGTYIDYIQKILRSTLGYLTINSVGQVVYNLIATPSPTRTLDENNAVLNDIEIDYTNIAKDMTFYNEDLPEVVDIIQSSNVTRYLHQTENGVRFPHVLRDISARVAAIFNLRKNRSAIYKHTVAHTEFEALLGSDLTVSSPDVLGGSGSVGTKVTGLTKGADTIDFESTDLLST